jgi:hypothetical protein
VIVLTPETCACQLATVEAALASLTARNKSPTGTDAALAVVLLPETCVCQLATVEAALANLTARNKSLIGSDAALAFALSPEMYVHLMAMVDALANLRVNSITASAADSVRTY